MLDKLGDKLNNYPFDDAAEKVIFVESKKINMSLPTNNKKSETQGNKNLKEQGKGSKFIKSSAKPAAVTKKVRSTGANRGS
ncbi:hypothetical protein [Segetibacter aerophilus]|uniref:Uncharacterized protein n=1 Tax=Segetibacter aerophilus TaxID=670293 RepID=A0A512B9E4_9BACT|nr:hypothetical protein [Segetibacter aerophilus]GEO08575.1 hypothetical protein SAE01_10710 [Segetibacter aerophilus]